MNSILKYPVQIVQKVNQLPLHEGGGEGRSGEGVVSDGGKGRDWVDMTGMGQDGIPGSVEGLSIPLCLKIALQ